MTYRYKASKFALSVLALATLQVGCSSGSSAPAKVNARFAVAAVTDFSPSVNETSPLPTSSSGMNNQSIKSALAQGGKISTTGSVLEVVELEEFVIDSASPGFYNEDANIDKDAGILIQFNSDGSAAVSTDGEIHDTNGDGAFELVGTYGAIISGAVDVSPEAGIIPGDAPPNVTLVWKTGYFDRVFVGIKTDNTDMPTNGSATYVARESLGQHSFAEYSGPSSSSSEFGVNYQSSFTPTSVGLLDNNGDFTTTLEANFESATVQGSAQGNLTNTRFSIENSTIQHSDLPTNIIFNPTSIANSDFSGSGTANIDNKTIAIEYGGSLYGPNAEEASVLFAGNHNDGTSINGGAYLFAE